MKELRRIPIFRGKDSEGHGWRYGSLIVGKQGKETFICSLGPSVKDGTATYFTYEVEPETVGEFIGVITINEQKVFEDDIVKTHYFYFDGHSESEKEDVCVVRFFPELATFGYVPINNEDEGFIDPGSLSDESPEVIGNIHDKPNPKATVEDIKAEGPAPKKSEPKELGEKGFVFIDDKNDPYWCRMWGKEPWYFYWHKAQKSWVSLRKVSQSEIWFANQKALSKEDAEIYHAQHEARLMGSDLSNS